MPRGICAHSPHGTQNPVKEEKKVKHSFTTRLISFVLVLVMVLGMFPGNTVHVHAANVEDDQAGASILSVTNDDTNLEIDYEKPPYKVDANGDPVYDEKGNLIYLTPQLALSETAEAGLTITDSSYDEYYSDENKTRWRQVFKGDFDKLRQWLESDDPDDRYIVLMEDIKKTISSGSFESIQISSVKILDLNGHTLELYDKRNGTTDQNTSANSHTSTLFEINGTGYTQGDNVSDPKKGALLTVIDSAGSNVVITDPEGEIAVKEKRTGRIYTNAYMIDHQKWDFWYYTQRDIFHVLNGDLVIYGGEFQAGRQKDQMKSNFSWDKLKTVIGDAVTLGTAIFEYATGIEAAEAARNDLLKIDMYKDLKEDLKDKYENTGEDESTGTSVKKDGSGGTQDKKNETPASTGADANNPKKDDTRDQTVAQKQNDNNKKEEDEKKGDKGTGNDANKDKSAKSDENTKIAEANKAIGTAALDKDKINAMVDSAIALGEGLFSLFGSQENTRATACIHGTVARVGNGCALVVYGGSFIGHGSTPNVRNAVIEASYVKEKKSISNTGDPLFGKSNGGLVYIYDGLFTAKAGANVFNMFTVNNSDSTIVNTYEVKSTDTGEDEKDGTPIVESESTEKKRPMLFSETYGIREVRFDTKMENGVETEVPVNTGNITVRGGEFRCYFEPTMMCTLNTSTKGTDKNEGQYCPECDKYDDCDCDDVDHHKFTGTAGTVNLGVESFGVDLIKDGRIQLVDVYGVGKLVLLDGGEPIEEEPEKDAINPSTGLPYTEEELRDMEDISDYPGTAPENTYTTDITNEEGIRHYRLFISDTELRCLEYLTVGPNTADTNSTHSFSLKTYYGRGTRAASAWVTDEENTRAPYSSNEGYFEFEYDDLDTSDGNSGGAPGVYVIPELGLSNALAAGEEIAQSDVWYYHMPVNHSGESLGNFEYTDTFMTGSYVQDDGDDDYWLWLGGGIGGVIWTIKKLLEDGKMVTGDYTVSFNRTREEGSRENMEKYKDKLTNKDYYTATYDNYNTNIKFFVYKVYRVDPLTRDNINENDENWAADEPLLEMRYGATNNSLKCKITLKEMEKAIARKLGDPDWTFRSGELYRIEFTVQEHMGFGYLGSQQDGEVEFVNHLTPATASSSILFRCVEKDEDKDAEHYNPDTKKYTYGQIPDWTPLQFVKMNEDGEYYKDETVRPGEYATVELLNGQPSLVDYEGARIFDVYYQWYILDDPEDETPTLIAGTDNVWVAQNALGGKQFHKPDNWLLAEDGSGNGINGETYAAIFDPTSDEASAYEAYFPNGLPMDPDDPKHSPDLWNYKMLHMYTEETAAAIDGMKKDETKPLYMANNNAKWGNTDSLYIPAKYAGKYLQCKMVVVNVRYPWLYDNLQTIKSHVIPITGVPNPGFAEVVPAANRDCTSGGQQGLGTMYINEVPTFSFTANELPATYRDQGYSLKLTTEDYLDGELVGSTTRGAAYTPTGYGSHEVVMKIEVVDSEGNSFGAVKYRYNFNIKFRPLITGAYYTVQVEGRQTKTDLTAEQFEARYADLGHFSDTVFVQIRAEELPQSMKDQGYYMQLNVVDEVDGEVVLSKNLGGGYLFNSVGYCPDAVGNHTIKLKAVMLDSNGNLVECSETVTFDLSLTLDFGMYNIKPAPSEEDLAAGVTDLGTINSRMFSFMYRPPTWALSYNIEAKIYDYVNGVLDSSNRSTLTHKLGDYINDMTGTYTVDFYPKGVGRHEVHMLLRLTDDSGNEVMEQEHVFHFQYVKEQPTGIDIGSYPTGITLSQGQTHALSWYVSPTATAEQKAVFTSSNPEIASVSSNGVITGGSRTGTVTITATTPCGGFSKTVKVKVNATSTPVAVAGIGLRVGEYLQSGSTTPTTVQPEDKYVYLSRVDGVLTLTMHNYVVRDNNVHYFHHADVSVGGDYTYAQIVANEYVNIVVEGDNLLKVKSSTYTGAGIFLFQGGKISGSGTLAIDNFNCIEVLDSDFTLSGAKLTLTASYQGIHGITSYNSSVDAGVTLSSGSITAETDYDAICADNVTISNGTYDLKSDSGNGIYAIGGTIAIKAGTLDINAYKNGIDGTTVTISGGTTKITAKKRGIDADTVTINGGTTWCKGCVRGVSTYKMDVTAGALYAEGSEYGIYAPYAYMTSYGGLDITGGSVLAKCTDTTGSSYCYAIDSSNYTPTLTGTYQFGATNGSGAGYTTLNASNLTGYDFVFVGEQPLYFSVWLNNRWLWDGCRIGRSPSSMEAATEPKVDTAYYKDGVLQLMGFDPVYGELKFGTRTLTIDMVDGYYNNLETITCSASYGLIIKGDAYLNVNMFADYDEGIRARGVTILDSAFVDVRASGTCIAACRSVTVNDGVLYLTGEGDSTIGITGYMRQGGTVSVKDGFLVSSGTNHSALGSTVSLSSSCNVDVRVGTNSNDTSTWDGTTSLSSYGYLSVDHAHTWSYVEPVAPTCVTDGSEGYYICTGCGRYFEMAHESWEFDDLTEIIIPATGHTMVDATCTLAEYCSVCMYSEGEPNGHDWIDATCAEPQHCADCGEITGDALEHTLDEGVVTTEATCSNEGVLTYTCSACGGTVEEAIPMDPNAHQIVTEADCVNPAKCGLCDSYVGFALGHSWVEATCTTARTCSVCHEIDGTVPGHDWVEATCAEAKHCAVCGITEGNALAHTWVEATCSAPRTCTGCWATEGEALPHTYAPATCDQGETCTVCGWVETDPSHSLTHHPAVAPTCTTDGTVEYWSCTKCNRNYSDLSGTVELENVVDPATGHTFEGVTDCTAENTCTVCGETISGGLHTLTSGTSSDLYHSGTCDVCGMTITNERHTFGDDDFCDVCGREVKLVTLIEVTLDDPVAGGTPDMTIGSADGVGYHADRIEWRLRDSTLGYPVLAEDDTFECGKYYFARIRVVRDDGYRFDKTQTVFKVNGASTSLISAGDAYYSFDRYYFVAHPAITKVDAVAPTCTTDGNVQYYHCDTCNKNYTTATGNTEITDVVLPALGHDYLDGTCTRCGQGEVFINITSQPVDYVGMVGDNATFTVVAEGEGLTYQWYYYDTAASSWKKSSGGNSANLSVVFAAYRNNQEYRCEITDMDGNTVTTDTVKLVAKVVDLVIVTQPVDYVGSVNDNLSFTVEAIGNGLTYQWYYSDNAGATWKISGTPGFDTATLLPILRAYRDGYQYYCKITDIFGNTVSSDVVSATVRSSEIVISQQPVAVTDGVLDQLHTFKVTASGDNLEYRWEYSADGGETWQLSWNQGYNADTLTVRLYAYRSGYLYRCKIVSGLKTVVYTDPVELVLQAPSATIVKQPANVAVVTGKTASFPVQVTGNDLTYQWYRSNDNGATWTKTYLGGYNTAALSFVANASRAALYKCQITDGSGKTIWSNVVKLQILSAELKILTQPQNVTCANGATATFTVEAQGDTLKYQWYSSADGGTTWTASYLTGYNTNTFSFAVNASRAARLYKCIITDAGGNTVDTNAVSVTIG